MCFGPQTQAPPPPPPAAPPVLEQQGPKSAGGDAAHTRKRQGLAAYRIETPSRTGTTSALGGIPTRSGTGGN